MMSAKEAKELSDKNRDGYLTGLLAHYLAEINKVIGYMANIGKIALSYNIEEAHYIEIGRKLRLELRKQGYKVKANKNVLTISWDDEDSDGLANSPKDKSR